MGSKELEVLHGIELEATNEVIEALGLILCEKKYGEGIIMLIREMGKNYD